MFERIEWKADRALLGDLVFRLEHYKNDSWELSDRCFVFYKIKELIDQYERAFARRPGWKPRHMLELGMWDGGSLAFWFELLQPEKLVGVDLAKRDDSAYFREHVAGRDLGNRIRTYWNSSQADRPVLDRIVNEDFGGHLDLVIDDASHLYLYTKTSFETLFPRMPEGSLYIIEDWAWGHWKPFQAPDHPWANEMPLTRLIFDLVEATGTSIRLINSLEVYEGFTIIERGPMAAEELKDFRLEDHISRKPEPVVAPRHRSVLRAVMKKIASR